MQTLVYESSWEKAIAPQDREMMEEVFEKTGLFEGQEVKFSIIRSALNYKGELLITGMIHNFGQEMFTVENQHLAYKEKDETVAEHLFTVPQVRLQAETSMPWTFIFPVDSIKKEPDLAAGQLDLTT